MSNSAAANIVVPWIPGSGALTISGISVLIWSFGLSTEFAAMTLFSFWLVRRYLHKAKELGSMVRKDAFMVEEEEVGRWGGWDWVWIDEVVLPAMLPWL